MAIQLHPGQTRRLSDGEQEDQEKEEKEQEKEEQKQEKKEEQEWEEQEEEEKEQEEKELEEQDQEEQEQEEQVQDKDGNDVEEGSPNHDDLKEVDGDKERTVAEVDELEPVCDGAEEEAPEDEDDIINISESEEEEDMAGDQISREQTHPPHHSSTPTYCNRHCETPQKSKWSYSRNGSFLWTVP